MGASTRRGGLIVDLQVAFFYFLHFYRQAAKWHDVYNRFRNGVKDIEVMMQNVINAAFETVTNVQHGAEILRSFVHLSSREV